MPVPPERRNIFYRFFNRAYDALERGYVRLISRLASASVISVVVALLIVAGGLYGLSRVASGFIPIEDQGYLVVAVQLPDGASLERTQKAMDQVGAIARRTPGVDQFVTVAGISPLDNSASLANAGVAYVTLKPWSERGKGQDLLSLFLGMNAAMQAGDGRARAGGAAAADPGCRQRLGRDHATRAARRQLRFPQAAEPRQRRWSRRAPASRASSA